MSNYSVTTNFGAKDALVSGNPLKLILGAQLTTEFNNIATAVNSKFDGLSAAAFALGSAAAPSVTFTGELGTGLYSNGSGDLGQATGGVARLTISGTTGAATIAAATSGASLTVNGTVNGANIAGFTDGTITIAASTSTGVGNFGTTSNHPLNLATNSATQWTISTAGNLTAAASSQTVFCNKFAPVTGLMTLTAGSGLSIVDGSGTVWGSPTGGAQGAGTLNVSGGLYINGTQIFAGAPASSNTTAALSDIGKMIRAAGTITIPNAVFSQGHGLSIYNTTAGSITITAGITTMRLAGTATTGSRTLAQRGIATIWFDSGTDCTVSGPGVT